MKGTEKLDVDPVQNAPSTVMARGKAGKHIGVASTPVLHQATLQLQPQQPAPLSYAFGSSDIDLEAGVVLERPGFGC